MAKYKLAQINGVVREDGAFIPLSESNRDYCEYIDWLAAGNIPDSATPESDVVSITTDSNTIIGDGVDEIILTVHGKPDALVTINTLCGATAGTLDVQLDINGNGSQAFSCDTSPTVISFSCGEANCKVRAL